MRRSGVFGGVLLILVGLLFLGGTLGILPPFTWSLSARCCAWRSACG